MKPMVIGAALRKDVLVCCAAAVLSLLVSNIPVLAQHPPKVQLPVKTVTNEFYAPFLINRVFNYYGNNGDGSYNMLDRFGGGFEFPQGSGKTTTFEDGIVWGGYHKGRSLPKVGGSVYRHALQAGRVLSPGSAAADPVADDPSLPRYRIYRVRPDVTPATPFDPTMATTLNRQEVSLISRYAPVSARELYDQYIRDWIEWPATDGAPYRDLNGNGTYESATDIPGCPGADQTLWYVANDGDLARVNSLAGSPVIGLEFQRTVWGYARGDFFANTIFIATKIINASGAPIDSMYIAQWFDPDLGDATDDLIGCDSSRSLGYAFNGQANDGSYGASPPAVGFTLLQGPMIAGGPGDTALFQGGFRYGYRNRGMTAFVGIMSGARLFHDPATGFGGEIQWYRNMKGTTADSGDAFIDPTTGLATTFTFSGDPVTAQGWVDGSLVPPGDRRCMLSTGPFQMATGDTQEVVLAHLVAQGTDRLSSVQLLKSHAERVGTFFRDPARPIPPRVEASVTYPSTLEASVRVTADFRPGHPQNATVLLESPDGSTLTQFAILDDGLHGEGLAGDGVFGSSITLPRQSTPVSLAMSITDHSGLVHLWHNLQEGITTAGPIYIDDPKLFSDNVNNDGVANPGENIRYGFTVRSLSLFPPGQVLLASGETKIQIPLMAAGTTYAMHYESADPQSYCTMTLPSDFTEAEVVIPVLLSDANRNVWSDTISFPVAPLPYKPAGYSLFQSGGQATGNFSLLVVDPARFTNHRYVIRGVDSIDVARSHGFTLKDSTDGRVLLLNHRLPDSLGHSILITDGFKILRGTTDVRTGTMRNLQTVQGALPWTSYGVSNVLGLEGFGGTIGNAFDHWPSGGVGYSRQHAIRIVFSSASAPASDSANSFAYRYLQNAGAPPAKPEFSSFIRNTSGVFAYQDYTRSLPFSAYDVSENPRRRLMVGFLENNVALGLVDGKYEPPLSGTPYDNGAADGPREWFFIFDAPYSETPDPALQVDISTMHVPLMWIGYPARRVNFRTGAELRIDTYHAPSSTDWWTFVLDRNDYIPASYQLYQNFPNPFNAGTTVRFTVPDPSYVTLKVYDLLGREVETLLSTSQYPGEVNAQWNGRNSEGNVVASGVYFYRLEATTLGDPGKRFVQVNKMMVLR